MEIELHANASTQQNSLALRNEEFNRARLKAGSGGGVRITDPEKFAKLQAEMKERQAQQAQLTAAREAERRRREGDAYKTPEERARLAKEARAAKGGAGSADEDGESARVVEGDDGKFDPKVDYYAILEVDAAASAKEIVAAYRKAALSMHPDKYKNESPEQQEAIANKFLGVTKAFKVLENEEMRAAYDKCRDYMQANPNKGLPTLTPEEQALVMRGAGELSRLKRMGPKLKKHDDLEKRIEVSLEELHFGCTKAVTVARQRVNYSGVNIVAEKTFHVVIKRGSDAGDVMRFEDEGEETVDTHAGDLVFTLQVMPHGVYKRHGERGLEVFVNVYDAGDDAGGGVDSEDVRHNIYHVIELETIGKKQCTLVLRSMYEALCRGGTGGGWSAVVAGQGLYAGPGKPAGDLVVSARFLPFFLEDVRAKGNGRIRSIVSAAGEVVVVGSAADVVGGSLVAGYVARRVRHRIDATEMIEESESTRNARVLTIDIAVGDDEPRASTLGAMRQVFECRSSTITNVTVCPHRGALDDAIWSSSAPYDAIVLSHAVLSSSASSAERESSMSAVRACLADVMSLVNLHRLRGADIVAIEGAVELLGARTGSLYAPILPHYQLRAGGGTNNAGFDDVITSLETTSDTRCVGILDGSAYVVDVETGEAEMIIAPHRDALVKKATWCEPEGVGVDEADEDFGFIVAYAS